ncbi:MAG: PIG-L family deacetylase [Verrucomicrobiota bacterium]|nr:PIG-L family deacetylase [Verrucomicrobiota bacterium]MDQ6939876.1 PIG-L family deacetylase [Verrucomicrobiota bacterium]
MRILALGAHPDDLEFACGGILLAEAERGSEMFFCVCSRGESGTNGTPAEREAEARAAADLLGAKIEFLDLGGDAHIEGTRQNGFAIARQIRLVRPDTLLSSVTSVDQHPDHYVVGSLACEAMRFARYAGIAELRELPPHTVAQHFQYAVTPAAEPRGAKIRVDISAYFEKWRTLMECHPTQMRTRKYVDLQTARAQLLGREIGVEYAQALFMTDDLVVKSLDEIPRNVRLF